MYENVILSGISYDYKSEFAMQFDLEFEQIRLVSTATVNVIAVLKRRGINLLVVR